MKHKVGNFALALAGLGLVVKRSRMAPGPSSRSTSGGASNAHEAEAAEPGRGRSAHAPKQIPRQGWKDILVRTWKEFGDDQIPMIAAGVTFYTLLAIFPGIGAFVALYGLFSDVADVREHVQMLSMVLPGGAITLISDQLEHAAAAREGGLSLAAIGGLLVTLWSANGAMKAIITGLNIAYDEKERRGFVRKTATSLGFTIGFLVLVLLGASLLAGQSAADAFWGGTASFMVGALGWPVIFAALVLGLAVLYRYGPSRDRVQWRWISWGSGLAALAWLIMSSGFSLYVGHYGSYDKTYGPLGAVIGFMTWTWLSSMVILLGAELNSEIEHQTAQDTTVGPEQPMGARGATMADTVGEAQ